MLVRSGHSTCVQRHMHHTEAVQISQRKARSHSAGSRRVVEERNVCDGQSFEDMIAVALCESSHLHAICHTFDSSDIGDKPPLITRNAIRSFPDRNCCSVHDLSCATGRDTQELQWPIAPSARSEATNWPLQVLMAILLGPGMLGTYFNQALTEAILVYKAQTYMRVDEDVCT